MGAIATVKIVDGQGDYVVINEVDFDPSQHQLWKVKGKGKGKGKAKASPAADSGAIAGDSGETVAADGEAQISARVKALSDGHTVGELKAIATGMGLEIKSRAKQAEIAEAIARAELAGGDG